MRLKYWGLAAIGAAVVATVLAVAYWPAPAAPSVEMRNFAFSPDNLHIEVGETVTWTNYDAEAHNIVMIMGEHMHAPQLAGDHADADIEGPLLENGESWSYTFTEAGTYTYHCHPHPTMTGTVVVG